MKRVIIPQELQVGKANPVGRPTSYKPEYAKIVNRLTLLGASDLQICDALECSEPTFYLWKKVHPEFSKAILDGKIVADANVAHSLYKRATGFEHGAVKIFMTKDEDGNPQTVYAPYKEYYAPDTAAAKHWLGNRQRGLWVDKSDDDGKHPGPMVNITINTVDPVQAANTYQKILEAG